MNWRNCLNSPHCLHWDLSGKHSRVGPRPHSSLVRSQLQDSFLQIAGVCFSLLPSSNVTYSQFGCFFFIYFICSSLILLCFFFKYILCIVISVTSFFPPCLNLYETKICYNVKYITWFLWLIGEFTEKNSMSGCVLSRSRSICLAISASYQRYPCWLHRLCISFSNHYQKKYSCPLDSPWNIGSKCCHYVGSKDDLH